MLEEAEAAGARIHLAATVVDVHFDKTQVVLEDGRVLEADVVVGADGKKESRYD